MVSHPPLIELKCRNCGSRLTPADISVQLAVARCPHCSSMFAIPNMPGRAIARPEVTLPDPFKVETTMDSISISRRWRSPAAFFLLFFTFFWNGFMVVWHSIALSQGAWMMSVFGLLHTGVGLFLIYFVLALFLNRTVIRANGYAVTVEIGPIPWKGNKTIPREDIEQIYLKERVNHGKNGSSTVYLVEMILRGNRRATLAAGINNADHALFVEQQLEKFLGISDVPVDGEYGR